jgi:hypothetical protein
MLSADQEVPMQRALVLAFTAVTLAVTGCAKEDDLNNVPGPNGLLPDGSPPRAAPPAAPDSGTYNSATNRNPRPPLSGLNSDPANPNGAPGTFNR